MSLAMPDRRTPLRREAVPGHRSAARPAVGLTCLLAALVAGASLIGLLVAGVYRGAESTAEMLRGYDLVNRLVVVPCLATAAHAAWRGSVMARPVLTSLVAALGGMWIYIAVDIAVTGDVPTGSRLVETNLVVHLGMALDLTLLVPLYAVAAVLLWQRGLLCLLGLLVGWARGRPERRQGPASGSTWRRTQGGPERPGTIRTRSRGGTVVRDDPWRGCISGRSSIDEEVW